MRQPTTTTAAAAAAAAAATTSTTTTTTTTTVDATVSVAHPAAAGGGMEVDIKKSERKRKRERQRRSDLATAFEELSVLVAQLDPEDTGGGRKPSGDTTSSRIPVAPSSTGEGTAPPPVVDVDGTGMTRLDLIGRTTMVLRRLQRENSDLRRRFEDVKKGGRMGDGVGDDTVRFLCLDCWLALYVLFRIWTESLTRRC
jgi:Helix-loop-helix DNA-binding domain